MVRLLLTGMYMLTVTMHMLSRHSQILCGGTGDSAVIITDSITDGTILIIRDCMPEVIHITGTAGIMAITGTILIMDIIRTTDGMEDRHIIAETELTITITGPVTVDAPVSQPAGPVLLRQDAAEHLLHMETA